MSMKEQHRPLSSVTLLGIGLVGLLLAAAGGVSAQMHQGQAGQMAGHQHNTQAMQGTMMSTQQMMQNVETMMKNVAGNMQNLASMQQGMGGIAPGGPMFSAMQGVLGHMKQLQGSMNEWMNNPQAMHDAAGMKSFQEACASFEQMARSFESMTKHMNDVAKGPGHGAKR